jgi:hypothetical protein
MQCGRIKSRMGVKLLKEQQWYSKMWQQNSLLWRDSAGIFSPLEGGYGVMIDIVLIVFPTRAWRFNSNVPFGPNCWEAAELNAFGYCPATVPDIFTMRGFVVLCCLMSELCFGGFKYCTTAMCWQWLGSFREAAERNSWHCCCSGSVWLNGASPPARDFNDERGSKLQVVVLCCLMSEWRSEKFRHYAIMCWFGKLQHNSRLDGPTAMQWCWKISVDWCL